MSPGSRIYKREFYYPGNVLMTQGETGTTAFVIERGKVAISARDATGNDIQLAVLGAGDIVGEMALITQAPRSATATVIEEATVVLVTASDFAEGLRKTDGTFQTLVTVLVDRLRAANRLMTADASAVSFDALEQELKTVVQLVEKKVRADDRVAFRQDVAGRLQDLLAVLRKYKD